MDRKRTLADVPKGTKERWARLKRKQLAQALGRKIARWRLPRSERKIKPVRDATFEVIKRNAIKSEHGRFPAYSTLMNIGLYLLIAERDIQALKIDMLTHSDEWTRKLCARVVLLTIYEWDADKVSGRALRDALDVLQVAPDIRTEAIEALRTLRAVQDKASKQFAFVRNAAIAHRDPDALVQYRAICDLRVDEVMSVAIEFYSGVHKFISVLTKLTAIGGSAPALLKQWTPNPKKSKP